MNESFDKIENLFNKIPSLKEESITYDTSQLYFDYNIKRNIVKYD